MFHGENLKKLRKQKNLTQKGLAQLLGLSISTIQKYELGQREPTTETLYKLSEIFGVNIDIFIKRLFSKDLIRFMNGEYTTDKQDPLYELINGPKNPFLQSISLSKDDEFIKVVLEYLGYDILINKKDNDEFDYVLITPNKEKFILSNEDTEELLNGLRDINLFELSRYVKKFNKKGD